MKPKELVGMGLPQDCIAEAIEAMKVSGVIHKPKAARAWLSEILAAPEKHESNLARRIVAFRMSGERESKEYGKNPYRHESGIAPYQVWGEMDEMSRKQMDSACSLPVAVQGAVMADNHPGWGIEIGGVLATHNSVLPMGVGVDISCSVKLTVLDLPVKNLLNVFSSRVDPLISALENGTVFGIGSSYKIKQQHPVMDADWNGSEITKQMKDKAWTQLGTSGSGNHHVEFGLLRLENADFGLEAGTYVSLLSHSGSRGAGAAVCRVYSDIAISKLPKQFQHLKHLAWLSLDSEAGQEYWYAMNLMHNYALANHETIHRRVSELAGAKIIAEITNSHNLAWKEIHDGKELIVHRKGATPAGEGVLGIILGSMADPCFVVRGKGNTESLNSASHGAGRKMSRTEARKRFHWSEWKAILKQRGVRLLSAGLDEVPGSYKPILEVMAAQTDLVDIVAQFDPKIVKMSDDGKSED